MATFTSGIAAQLTLDWTVPGAGATPVTIASTSHSFAVPATSKLTLALTAAGRRLFRAATRSLTLTATATFAVGTGSITVAKQLTLTYPRRPKRR